MPTASSFAIAGCVAWTPIENISNALILVDRGVVSYAGPAGSIPLPLGAEVFDFGAGGSAWLPLADQPGQWGLFRGVLTRP